MAYYKKVKKHDVNHKNGLEAHNIIRRTEPKFRTVVSETREWRDRYTDTFIEVLQT